MHLSSPTWQPAWTSVWVNFPLVWTWTAVPILNHLCQCYILFLIIIQNITNGCFRHVPLHIPKHLSIVRGSLCSVFSNMSPVWEYLWHVLSVFRERKCEGVVLMLLGNKEDLTNDMSRKVTKQVAHRLAEVSRNVLIQGWFFYCRNHKAAY